MIIGVHFWIIPTRSLASITDRNSLLVDRQGFHVEQRPKPIELFIGDQDIDSLRPRIDDSHRSVPGTLNHFLKFSGKCCHANSVPGIRKMQSSFFPFTDS